ncbi:hypothetical protein [Brumimicrobium sp.]|uniref:hypothetical protein n=1 Tax=Brumimicrobium sp. TaxID=2029867 RepID=UPI003A8FB1AB
MDVIKDNFFYIWLVLAVSMLAFFFIVGEKAMRKFKSLETKHILFSEKFASGYSTKSLRTRHGGASKLLHIVITEKELILKTYLFMAFIAKKHDLLHIIPLTDIVSTELKKNNIHSKLHIKFFGVNGEEKEIVLMSDRILKIKKILDQYIAKHNSLKE